MAVFMLETDSATGASTQVTSLASQLDSVASNVEGYDTSAEGFDFAGPKSVLAASIKACATKMKNTSNYIESVVSSHTSFQNAVKFESAEEKAAREAAEKKAKSGNNNSNKSSSGGGRNSSGGGGGYSGGGGGGSRSGGGSTGGGNKPEKETEPKTEPATDPKTEPETEPATTPETTPEQSTIIKPVEIEEKIEKVSEKDFKDAELSGASKKIFDHVEYNEQGYATYNGLLVISCGAAFGAVGDVIQLQLKDGTSVDCIIGQVDNSLNNEVVFAVNDKFNKENEKNITNNLVENIDKVINTAPGQPALGVYTKEYESGENKVTIAETKGDLDKYLEGIKDKLVQNVDKDKYKDKDLSFAETHAYGLFSGKTDDTIETASSYKKSGFFTSFKTDSLDETLHKIYTEISNGRPVVTQISENAAGTVGHYVTIVGFNNTITDPSKLTEKDLVILDSADGTIKPLDGETNKLVTAKQTHNGNDGYTLRVLKDDDPNKTITNMPTDRTNSDPTDTISVPKDDQTPTENTQTQDTSSNTDTTQTENQNNNNQITESEESVTT